MTRVSIQLTVRFKLNLVFSQGSMFYYLQQKFLKFWKIMEGVFQENFEEI